MKKNVLLKFTHHLQNYIWAKFACITHFYEEKNINKLISNMWAKRIRKPKSKAICNFPISALTAKEQLNVWNIMQGSTSPGEPINLEVS